MKKIIVAIAFILTLTGCSFNQENEDTSTSFINSKDNISSSQNTSLIEDKYDIKEFTAQNLGGTEVNSYDFETAYTMCVQALSEYGYARVNKKPMDFSKYVEDEKLLSYMNKKLTSPSCCMYEGEVNRTGLIEFEIQEENCTGFDSDRLYLHMSWGDIKDSFSGGFSTRVEFIVKNLNGKLVIAEWYDCGKDTFDTIFRGDLDIKKDDIYWNTVDTALLNKKITEHIKEYKELNK